MPSDSPRIAVLPDSGRVESLRAAVVAGGGTLVDLAEAEALVWADAARPHDLPAALTSGPDIRWVALPYAGIEPYLPYLDHERVWTAAKGVYATPVAEHVIALSLAGLRCLHTFARAATWPPQIGRNLIGANVVVFGGGGITSELVRLLEPFRCDVTVVRRSNEAFPGASATVSLDDRLDVLPSADLVVLALALTPETAGVIGSEELAAMADHAWLVNVARGGHVDTDALVDALAAESIGGAALDVTDPEPLPPHHPLWSEPRALISPHVGNTPEMGVPLLAAHITDNVRRFGRGEPLVGIVDPTIGY
jgi:phosphoglycerate dehydrogenase-like enzyme